MTKYEWEELTVLKGLLLECKRLAHKATKRIQSQLEECCIVEIGYNEHGDCLEFICEGSDDDYLGVRYEVFSSLEDMLKDSGVEVEE